MFDGNNTRRLTSRLIVTGVALLVVLSATPVAVQAAESLVTGEPDLSATAADTTFEASSAQTLTVTISNTGTVMKGGQATYEREVQTAQGLQVKILEDRINAPIDVMTGTHVVSSLPDGAATQQRFRLEIGKAKPGTYRIPVQLSYEHTRSVTYGPYRETQRTTDEQQETQYITITVEDKPQFEIVTEGANSVFSGDTGTLSFELKNTGTRTATAASVQLASQSSTIYFGSMANPQPSTNLYISSLSPGETTNLSVQVGAGSETAPGRYPIDTTVSYRNQNGVTEQSDTLTTGVLVRPKRTFAITNLQTTNFRVDETEAKITGQIVNTGPGPANNVAVQLGSTSTATAKNGESAVGDLAPGESKPVSFTLTIPASAEPGTNTFPFTVQYENADGDVRSTDTPIRKSITIGPEQNPFEVVNVNTSVSPGGSGTLTVAVEYQGEAPTSATNAKLFVSDPLSSSDDGAYLGTMQPGETKTATFTVSAASSALTKDYDASIEIRYDEPDGDTKYTNGLPIGIPVSPSSGGLPVPLPIIGGVVLVIAGAVYVLYQRR